MAAQMALGRRHMPPLRTMPVPTDAELPSASVVITALNEERSIEQALRSVLAQDYPGLEVIVVNDRSTDRTGAILDRMAEQESRLRVIHNQELPSGWLGKNHALQLGAGAARGDLLLFTDADVIFEPSSLRRAVGYLLRERFDHLAVAPEIVVPGPLLGMFMGAFAVFFNLYARTWKVRDPKSSAHVGIGAFNLLRADAYRRIGGHEPIRMRPDDDMKLGKLVKAAGLRQALAMGRGLVRVEWYSSLREVARGLEKNSFSGVEYSVVRLVGSTFALLAFNVWPFVAVFVTSGVTRMLYAAIAVLLLAVAAGGIRESGGKAWHALGFPFASLFFLYVLWRSTLKALWNRGIDWRGTHYSLDALRANRV